MQYEKKLDEIEARFEGLNRKMTDPDLVNDPEAYRKTTKTHSELYEVVSKYREWKQIRSHVEEARPMLLEADPELREMATEEVQKLEPELERLEGELKILLLPKDPHDEKNVVLEIRAGTGGDEATLFAAEIFRMYSRYAEAQGWKVEVSSVSESSIGGSKEVIALINGEKVYSRLKYESGVHRVQRVPVTEQQGRVHTSAITVAVLPEADEVEVQIDPKDIRIDTFCSSGPGGQSVNTTYSAVRITHLPTGIVVTCQNERSQGRNRDSAMKVLRARLYDLKMKEQQARLEQLGGEKKDIAFGSQIRSYVLHPYQLIKDHRTKEEVGDVNRVLDGDLDPFIKSYLRQKAAGTLGQAKGADEE